MTQERAQTENLLHLLDAAALEIHPERFFDPDDAGLFLTPKLVIFNRLIGTPDENRFLSVEYENIVQAVARYEEAGMSAQLSKLTSPEDIVSGALIGAGHHEHKLRRNGEADNDTNLGKEIRETANIVINFLNQGATNQPAKPQST
jgi:hypothetical protein